MQFKTALFEMGGKTWFKMALFEIRRGLRRHLLTWFKTADKTARRFKLL
jgi:hypothetical protein